MELTYLVMCLLCMGFTFREACSQPSYMCRPAEEILPADHICREVFPNNTLIMVPNPEQTKEYKRNFPTSGPSLQRLVNESIQDSNGYISLLSPTDCSDNIFLLVCFYYFPPCKILRGKFLPAFPCLDVCKEVSESCNASFVHSGKQFAHCNATYSHATADHSKLQELPVFIDRNENRPCSYKPSLATQPPPVATPKPTAQTCPDYASKLPEG